MPRLPIACCAALLWAATLPAQSPPEQHPLAFDVASVKPSKSGAQSYSNFPLGPGDVYVSNGGLFSATNFPLVTYIFFAYKILGSQSQSLVQQLPGWVMTDGFDIQARAEGNPTKDQMRLMMRSLLADRFKLAIHTETREVPVVALVPAKPGKLGPQIRPHSNDSSCQTTVAPQGNPSQVPAEALQTVEGGFPALCNGILGLPPSVPGRLRLGARNLAMPFIANSLTGRANLGRPMIDGTGLTGTFDFTLEYTPELQGPLPPGVNFTPDPSGPTFEQALRDQLGLKLESRKGSTDAIVVDHVEHPSEN